MAQFGTVTTGIDTSQFITKVTGATGNLSVFNATGGLDNSSVKLSGLIGVEILGYPSDRVYYVSETGDDGTAEAGNPDKPWLTIKAACTAAYAQWLADEPTKITPQAGDHALLLEENKTLVYVKTGTYYENEVNNYRNDIYMEPKTVLWTDVGGRSLFSDRHLGSGYVKLNIWTYNCVTIHKNYTAGNDAQTHNYRRYGCDIHQYGGIIDTAQLWVTGMQSIHLENLTQLEGYLGSSRGYNKVSYKNCWFRNSIMINPNDGTYNKVTLEDCVVDVPEQYYIPTIYDYQGNELFTWNPLLPSIDVVSRISNPFYLPFDGTAQYCTVAGTSGTGVLTIRDSGYTMTFNTDIETTIDDFVDNNLSDVTSAWIYNYITRLKEVTLTGTTGTCNITIGGTNYLATFDTDLETTAENFSRTHQNALDTASYRVAARGEKLYVVREEGTTRGNMAVNETTFTVSISGGSGDLGGSVVPMLRIMDTSMSQIGDLVSFSGTSGDLNVTFADGITDAEIRLINIADGIKGATIMGMGPQWGVYGGGNKGASLIIKNSKIFLYKKKTWGLYFSQRQAQDTNADSFIKLENVQIIDRSGGSTANNNGTTGIISVGTEVTNKDYLWVEGVIMDTDVKYYRIPNYPWAPIISGSDYIRNQGVLSYSNYAATGAPSANDDITSGYNIQSKWYDTIGTTLYECVDATEGAAVWISIG